MKTVELMDNVHRCVFTQKGNTLVELLAYLAITGMLMAALGGVMINGWRAYESIDNYAELQENARAGMGMIARDVQLCGNVLSAQNGVIDMTGSDGYNLKYRTADRTLYRVAKGTANPVCINVERFEVAEGPPDTVRILLETQNQGRSYLLQTRVARVGD